MQQSIRKDVAAIKISRQLDFIYRQEINGREAVCLIFSSGKCVITGCASFEDAEEAAETLAETLGDVL